MVDLVMDLVANLVDNRGSGNMVGSRGNSNSRCSLNLNSLDRGSNMVSNRGDRNCGSGSNSSLDLNSLDSRGSDSVVSNRGSNWNNWGSVGDRINKSILVHILRESLQGERGIATVGSNKVTNKRGERSRS